MTTLAYKDGVLAADSLVTCNGARDGHVLKIRRIGGVLVGGAGSSARCEKFFDWVKKGMKGDSPWFGHDDGNSLVIAPDNLVLVFGQGGFWRVTNDFHALGSGERFAMGAMGFGASAEQAIGVAARFDIYTGGPIRSLRIKS